MIITTSQEDKQAAACTTEISGIYSSSNHGSRRTSAGSSTNTNSQPLEAGCRKPESSTSGGYHDATAHVAPMDAVGHCRSVVSASARRSAAQGLVELFLAGQASRI